MLFRYLKSLIHNSVAELRMKTKMKKLLLTVLCTVALYLQALAQDFPRCILAGDYADPSIMREGKDFYMTHSMFNYNPGFLIWHSQDLVNWEPVCRVATKQLSNAWAPELFKLKGKYYLYYLKSADNFSIV